jgi:hypothetical protein
MPASHNQNPQKNNIQPMKISSSSSAYRVLWQVVLAFALGITTGQNLLGNDYDSYLVARYNFENTNNPYADSSGNNNNPDEFTSGSQPDTFSTNAAVGQYARLYFGDTCFSFDQSASAYPNLSNALSGNFSVTAWVMTTNSVNANYANAYYGAPIFFAGADYNNHCTIPLSITGNVAAFTVVSQDGPGTITLHSTTSVNDGNYHFLAVTRQQSNGLMSVYVDGNLEATGTGITNPVITQGWISVAGGYNFYSGLLDDVRIYSTNLSAGDVADIESEDNVITLADAISVPNLPVSTSGDTSWFVESTNTYNDAPYAAESGSVTGSQSSTLSVTVTGPGTLTYYWSSQDDCANFDYEFEIDGSYQNDIDCSQPWVQDGPYSIPVGQHTLTWTTYAYGDDDPTEVGFLDQVVFTPITVTLTNPQIKDGQFQFQFYATDGIDYAVYSTTNLASGNWTYFATYAGLDGTYTLHFATNSAPTFYTVQPQ